jgi:hypothetical protein
VDVEGGQRDVEERLARLELTLLEVVTALGMLVSELALRDDLALAKPEVVEQALERGWSQLFDGVSDRALAAAPATEVAEERVRRLFEVRPDLATPNRIAANGPDALEHAMAETGAAVGAIYEADPGGAAARLVAWKGYPDEVMEQFRDVSVEDDVPVAAVLRSGHPLWFHERGEILERYPALRDAHERTESAIGQLGVQGAVIPMTVEGRVVALLLIGFAAGG